MEKLKIGEKIKSIIKIRLYKNIEERLNLFKCMLVARKLFGRGCITNSTVCATKFLLCSSRNTQQRYLGNLDLCQSVRTWWMRHRQSTSKRRMVHCGRKTKADSKAKDQEGTSKNVELGSEGVAPHSSAILFLLFCYSYKKEESQ